jgi:hypothetical protein
MSARLFFALWSSFVVLLASLPAVAVARFFDSAQTKWRTARAGFMVTL